MDKANKNNYGIPKSIGLIMNEENWHIRHAVWVFHNEVWKTKADIYEKIVKENCPELLDAAKEEIAEKTIKIRENLMKRQKQIKECYKNRKINE